MKILRLLSIFLLFEFAFDSNAFNCAELLARYPTVSQYYDFTCGVACMRSILQGRGFYDPGEYWLAYESGTFLIGMTPPKNIVARMQARGLFARSEIYRSAQDIRRFYAAGESVILSVHDDVPHYVLLNGFSGNYLRLMDPWTARNPNTPIKIVSTEEFLQQWYRFVRPGYQYTGHIIRVSAKPLID